MPRLNTVDYAAMVLLIIGGINWGLIGFFDFNLVDSIFGTGSIVSRIIYAVVGLSALWAIYTLTKSSTAGRSEAGMRDRSRRAA